MPIVVTEEMKSKVIKLITDNPIIKRTLLVDISGQKHWYISGTLAELTESKVIFRQVRNGHAYYCTMDYAIKNNVPRRIVKNKKSGPYIQPNAKDVSLLGEIKMFNKLFQQVAH